MRFSNTLQHLWTGLVIGILTAFLTNAINLIWLWLVCVFGFLACTMGWEFWQWKKSKLGWHEYMAVKGLDTVVDIAVGNAAFMLPMVVIWFGTGH